MLCRANFWSVRTSEQWGPRELIDLSGDRRETQQRTSEGRISYPASVPVVVGCNLTALQVENNQEVPPHTHTHTLFQLREQSLVSMVIAV